MADNIGIMLTELPEAHSISNNDLMYIVQGDDSEKVEWGTLKETITGKGYGEASGNPATFEDGYASALVNCEMEIEATQSGSGTPSPSNPRPISGVSSVNITVAGKNLCFNTLGNINSPTDYLYPSGDGVGIVVNNTVRTAYAKVVKNTDYVFSCGATPQKTIAYGLEGYPAIGVICHSLTVTQLSTTSYKFNSGNYEYIAFYYCNDLNNIPSNIMIEEGTTATTYEPYNGSTVTIQLGDTYYGGTFDAATGKLFVTHGIVDLGDLDWTYNSSSAEFVSTTSPDNIKLNMAYNPQAICSEYEVVEWQSGTGERLFLSNASKIYGKGFSVTTPSDFKSLMEGVDFCYELETPFTIQLAPSTINALDGQNYIWNSLGDVDVVYNKGGAAIEPNPAGEADSTLTSLGINGKKFSISGGGGSSSGMTVTDLWTNNNNAGVGTYYISETISNYDALEVWYGVYSEFTGSPYISESKIFSVDTINALHTASKTLLITGYANRSVYVKFYGSTMQIVSGSENTILKVRGIKF